MSGWLMVALMGGIVGLDATSFPQVMISRPLVAGTLTGLLFGRPTEGMIIGFVLEAYALITLPIGAARYPESGTATVAAAAAYLTATPPGMHPGPLVVVLAFALAWEWLAGQSVVLQRRSNGQMLARDEAMSAEPLERRHLLAMTADFGRAATMAVGGGLIAYGLLWLTGPEWGIPTDATYGMLGVLVATMLGTTLPLFGGLRSRRLALGLGLGAGLGLVLLL